MDLDSRADRHFLRAELPGYQYVFEIGKLSPCH